MINYSAMLPLCLHLKPKQNHSKCVCQPASHKSNIDTLSSALLCFLPKKTFLPFSWNWPLKVSGKDWLFAFCLSLLTINTNLSSSRHLPLIPLTLFSSSQLLFCLLTIKAKSPLLWAQIKIQSESKGLQCSDNKRVYVTTNAFRRKYLKEKKRKLLENMELFPSVHFPMG